MKNLLRPVLSLRDQIFDIRTAVVASSALTASARRRAILRDIRTQSPMAG